MPRLVTRIVTLAFVALLAACSTVGTSGVKNTSKTFSTVVVDAGHGGNDSGAFRRTSTEWRDSEYRELLADRIAEAIVEQRYGAGVYRPLLKSLPN